jgi:uncharacterized protein YqfA (UPF0365 family)
MDAVRIGQLFVVILGLITATLLFSLVAFARYFRVWLIALFGGARISFLHLIGMTLRRVDPNVIVESSIMAAKAGLDVSPWDLEVHYLARGDVMNIVRGMIVANKAGLNLQFKQAAVIDLAGRDVLDVVKTLVFAGRTSQMSAILSQPPPAQPEKQEMVDAVRALIESGAIEPSDIIKIIEEATAVQRH